MVDVGEAASGPADGDRTQATDVLDNRFANAADVGNFGVRSDPNSVVDDTA